jgi:glycosyltransferase involved in cell wall biosynthesis
VDVTFVLPKRFSLSVPYAKMVSAEIEKSGAAVRYIDSPLVPYAHNGSYAVDEDGEPIYGNDLVSETRRYAKAAAKIARQEPHDVIYAHDWLSFGAGTAAKRASQKPLIAHVHATEFDRTGGSGVNQDVYDIERMGMHEADRVITVSHRTKEMALRHYGIPEGKVRVIWNGIDDETAPRPDAAVAPRLKALKDAGYELVLFAGRLTLQKGPDYFLRAAAKIARAHPNALFIVAGSGDMERQLMRQAAGLGIGDRVLFPGFLRDHDLHEAYAAADIYVMPSVSEPFGITALEAMRVGTPVILSRQSGVAEAVPGAVAVDFWDVDALAARMSEILRSAELRQKLSAEGVLAAAELTWDRAASQVRAVMDELVPAV